MGFLVGFGFHAYVREDFVDTAVDFTFVLPSGCPEDEFQVGFNGPVHQQLEILEDHAEPAAQERDVFGADAPEVESADRSLTVQEAVFRRHGTDDGRLAGSHLPDNVDEITREDVHVEAVENDTLTVADVRAAKLYQWFHFCRH